MKDYRAATWAIVATTLMVLTAAGAIPATAAILGLAAGCSGLAFLHALLHPRTETIGIQVGVVNVPQPRVASASPVDMAEFMRIYRGVDDGDPSPGDAGGGAWCPVHGPSCPN